MDETGWPQKARSVMHQVGYDAWCSEDQRYLVLRLAAGRYQCFEHTDTGWVAAAGPCTHTETVMRQETTPSPSAESRHETIIKL